MESVAWPAAQETDAGEAPTPAKPRVCGGLLDDRQAAPRLAGPPGAVQWRSEVPMIQTVEAVIDENGHVRLLGEVRVDAPPPGVGDGAG